MKILAIAALSVPFVVPVMLAAPRAASGRGMSDDAVRAEAESDTVVSKFTKLYRKRDYSPRLRDRSTPVDTLADTTAVMVYDEPEDSIAIDTDTAVVAAELAPAAAIGVARLGIAGSSIWTPMTVTATTTVQGGTRFYVRYTLLHAGGRPVANPKAAKGEWIGAKGVITRTKKLDVKATMAPVTRNINTEIKRYLLKDIDLLSAVKVRIEILDADRKVLARAETNTVKP